MPKQTESRVVIKSIKDKSQHKSICCGFAKTAFGEIFLGWLEQKNNMICALRFVQKENQKACQLDFQKRWPRATLVENSKLAEQIAELIFGNESNVIEIAVDGTPFQQAVWEALTKIPLGSTCTYSDVAELMGNPKAVRAVANAVANNNIPVLIPCHRVVAKTGNKFKYAYGPDLKRKLLDWEGVKL